MDNPAAAHIAEALRAAKKQQGLSGADIADAVERLTGERPNDMRISRWLSGRHRDRPLVSVSPDLAVIAAVLHVDAAHLACGAVRAELAGQEGGTPDPARQTSRNEDQGSAPCSLAGVGDHDCAEHPPNPYQSPRCEHPDRAGEGCQACCDDCNSDRHRCSGCGTPVGHRTGTCPDCLARDNSEEN